MILLFLFVPDFWCSTSFVICAQFVFVLLWSVVKHVLLVCEFIRLLAGKIAWALQHKCSFSSEKSNELTDQQDMVCFNHASAFSTSKNIVKNVDE